MLLLYISVFFFIFFSETYVLHNNYSYIDEFDNTCGKTDINKHGHFYSLCQVRSWIIHTSKCII